MPATRPEAARDRLFGVKNEQFQQRRSYRFYNVPAARRRCGCPAEREGSGSSAVNAGIALKRRLEVHGAGFPSMVNG
jgi:hypothetical protein